MADPVRGPRETDVAFEKEAIGAWIARHGRVCPITHAFLDRTVLAPLPELRARILAWRLRHDNPGGVRDSDRKPGDNKHDDEDDLYMF